MDEFQKCPTTTYKLLHAAELIGAWQIRLEDDPRGLAAVNEIAQALGFCAHTPRKRKA